ncbi:MAG: hypothetical protein ACO4AJ_00245 [Prochlorothrix sp.]|nr:hypothetical protein [Prochlorothrix sp.]
MSPISRQSIGRDRPSIVPDPTKTHWLWDTSRRGIRGWVDCPHLAGYLGAVIIKL